MFYQFMATTTPSANTTTGAHVWMPMLGYMTRFGMNLMAGAQGQFYDTKFAGFIDVVADQSETITEPGPGGPAT